jgi:putative chitinase
VNITADQLIACGIGPTQAGIFAAPLTEACVRFDIVSPARIAGFLGQCMVETGLFVHLEESLYYTDPARIYAIFPSHFTGPGGASFYAKNPQRLGSRVYANRLGNGDEASGDGFRFRGRGALQLTGRDAYTAAAAGLGRDYVSSPDLVAQPADACLTAAWFWHDRGLNALADAVAFDDITKAVNGRAMLEAGLRKQYTEQALNAFSE